MEIKSLTLKNIGHFKELTIPFAPLEEGKPKVTVFIGNNGSGKTNILKSVVTALSWLPARIRTERGRGLDIPEDVICNDKTSALVSIDVSVDFNEYQWVLSKASKGRKNQFTSEFKGVAALADQYRHDLTIRNSDTNLPLIVFYPVERSVLDIPLKIRTSHRFDQLNAYDNALDMGAGAGAGVDFRRFFEWFRDQEDAENEIRSDILYHDSEREYKLQDEINGLDSQIQSISSNTKDLNNSMESMVELLSLRKDLYKQLKDIKVERENIQKDFLPLTAVKQSIKKFTGFENIWVQRKPRLRMVVKKDKKEFNVFQLSQGEKSLMALVGDIARRLVMLNPNLENPLYGKGVIIIDEADLHLHPQWQRQLIARLTQTFPNCQFILSTHSPLVISDSKDIVVYALENGEMTKIPSQYGQDANTVYLNAMDTAIRNQQVTEQLNDLLDLIQDNELEQAKRKLSELKKQLPENHLELTKAQFLLKKQEIRHAKNP